MLPSSYVIRRGRTYSFRCRLPADLAARIGRREFVRAFGTDQAPIARLLAAGIGLRLAGLWTVLRMDGLGQDVEEALSKWFRQEVDRVWRQFRTGAHAGDLVPPDATRDEELEIQRAALRGDAGNRLHHLLEDYQKGDYGAAGVGARSVMASLSAPFDDGDQRFTMLVKRVMEGLGEIEEASLRWAEGGNCRVRAVSAVQRRSGAGSCP